MDQSQQFRESSRVQPATAAELSRGTEQDFSWAEATANDLLLLAMQIRDLAEHHATEAPEDFQEAQAAVAQAKQTLTQIQISPRTGANARQAFKLVSQLSTTVSAVAATIVDHEAGTPTSITRKAQLTAATYAKPAQPKTQPLLLAPKVVGCVAPVMSVPLLEMLAQPVSPRKATGYVSEQIVAMLGNITTTPVADEVVSTVATGGETVVQGVAAVAAGEEKAVEASGLRFGRGVRNVLRDDLGLNATVAQTIGHAATVTTQTVGKGLAFARNSVVSGVMYVGDSVADATAGARDYAESWTELGDALEKIRDEVQRSSMGAALDHNNDGIVRLCEITETLHAMGISDLKTIDSNQDFSVSMRELQAALTRQLQPGESLAQTKETLDYKPMPG